MEQNQTPISEAQNLLPLKARIELLEEKVTKLKIICDELDPYGEIPKHLSEKLAEFQIIDLFDPFKVTNQLLILLEDSLEELEILKK